MGEHSDEYNRLSAYAMAPANPAPTPSHPQFHKAKLSGSGTVVVPGIKSPPPVSTAPPPSAALMQSLLSFRKNYASTDFLNSILTNKNVLPFSQFR